MNRAVRGIASRIILGRPAAAGRVIRAQLPAFLQELTVEFLRAGPLQRSRIDQRRKELVNSGAKALGAAPRDDYTDSLTSLNWMSGATSVYFGMSAVTS